PRERGGGEPGDSTRRRREANPVRRPHEEPGIERAKTCAHVRPHESCARSTERSPFCTLSPSGTIRILRRFREAHGAPGSESSRYRRMAPIVSGERPSLGEIETGRNQLHRSAVRASRVSWPWK